MATNPFNEPEISGYNTNPPPDDGSKTDANEITWAKHKTKLSDPIKTYADAIKSAATSAFAALALNSHVTDVNASNPSEGDGLIWDEGTSKWVNGPISSLPRSYLAGLGLSHAADTDHDITIAVGEARDGGDTADLVLSAPLTKRIDAAWAVGTGNGGLDTGSVAVDTWYHVWLIRRSDTAVVDALFSTSATSPTMPTDYDQKRRIGSVLTDGSANIIGFSQEGDEFLLDVPVADYSTSNPGTSATLRTLTVPTGIRVTAIHAFTMQSSGASNVASAGLITSPDATDTAPSTSLFNVRLAIGSGNATSWSTEMRIRTNTSGQIRTRFDASVAALTIYGTTMGWMDRRGRED